MMYYYCQPGKIRSLMSLPNITLAWLKKSFLLVLPMMCKADVHVHNILQNLVNTGALLCYAGLFSVK